MTQPVTGPFNPPIPTINPDQGNDVLQIELSGALNEFEQALNAGASISTIQKTGENLQDAVARLEYGSPQDVVVGQNFLNDIANAPALQAVYNDCTSDPERLGKDLGTLYNSPQQWALASQYLQQFANSYTPFK